MICPRCGTVNPDRQERCQRCRGSLAPRPSGEEIAASAAAREKAPVVAPVSPPQASDTTPSGGGSSPVAPDEPGPPPARPGSWPPPGPRQPNVDPTSAGVPNYVVPAILCTVLLNPVPGGVALIYAVLARRRLAVGNLDGAVRASHLARTWCWVSLIVFLLAILLIASGIMGMPRFGG